MEHFFCYDKELAIFIHKHGYKSVTTALSPSTKRKFTLFIKSERLQQIIDEYQQLKTIQ